MSSHAPGSWKRRKNVLGRTTSDIIGPNGLVCTVFSHEEGDVRLIVAAPELLESCEWLVGMMEDAFTNGYGRNDDNGLLCHEVIGRAKMAIAKAEGGE